MFVVAVLAAVLAANVLTALLVVAACRLLLGVSLTLGSAFKAVFLVMVVMLLAVLALQLAGIRLLRITGSPIDSVLLPLVSEVLLVVFLVWLGKTSDGEPIGWPRAAIAVLIASLAGYALGWVAFKAFLPPELSALHADASARRFELPATSQICLRSLARILSDTGSGLQPGAAAAYEQRLEQDARARAITMEEALREELRKFGGPPPTGCAHLAD